MLKLISEILRNKCVKVKITLFRINNTKLTVFINLIFFYFNKASVYFSLLGIKKVKWGSVRSCFTSSMSMLLTTHLWYISNALGRPKVYLPGKFFVLPKFSQKVIKKTNKKLNLAKEKYPNLIKWNWQYWFNNNGYSFLKDGTRTVFTFFYNDGK